MPISVSQGYAQAFADGAFPLLRATLTLADSTVLALTGADMAMGGLTFERATSMAGEFRVGAAVVGTATLTLANYDGAYDSTDFGGATVAAYVGAEVDGDDEWALVGTYDVERPRSVGSVVPLRLTDMLGRAAAAPYSGVSTTYPATLGTIVADICTHLGLTLATPTFANSTYSVASAPVGELTCLDALSFAAQVAGCFAHALPDGSVAFGWYDPDAWEGTPQSTTAIRSLESDQDEVTITGVRVTAQPQVNADGSLGSDGESALSGTEGYVIAIADNPLVQYGQAATVAAQVAAQAVGLTFRPLTANVVMGPQVIAGDALSITDRRGRVANAYLTRTTWSADGGLSVACEAEPASRSSAPARSTAAGRAMSVVEQAVRAAQSAAGAAATVASEAARVANATNQHFFADTNGIHVTEAEGDPATEHNILINSLGILLRNALNNLVSITQSATAFYDGLGNAASNVVAQFGRSGFQVGRSGESHLSGDDSSLEFVDLYENTYFKVADLRSSSDYVEKSKTFYGHGGNTYIVQEFVASVISVSVNGDTTTYSGTIYFARSGYIVVSPTPAAGSSVTITYMTDNVLAKTYTLGYRLPNASEGSMSVAEGFNVEASGDYSHAEGWFTTASGDNSHSEGDSTSAYGAGSHAEGDESFSGGTASHAEGYQTNASGVAAHSQNCGTKASSDYQTAMGRYNIEDLVDDYALIIGNGTDDNNRSNALAVRWDGTVEAAKPLPVASGGTGSTGFGTIVTTDVSTAVSVPDSSWKSLGSVTLAKGDWIVSYNAYFASNATGRRGMLIHTTADATSAANLRQGGVEVMAVDGGNTMLNGCRVLHLASTQTWHLNVLQTSGAALNVTGYIRAFRLT